MTVDRDRLRTQADAARPPEPGGAAGLLRAARRDPALANWLTIESVLLAPVPTRGEAGWSLVSLVAVPSKTDLRRSVFCPPWGAIRWEWPSGAVMEQIDLRESPTSGEAYAQAASAPEEEWEIGGPPETAHVLQSLLASLTELLEDPNTAPEDFRTLRPGYDVVLPAGAIALYEHLAHDVEEWLGRDQTRAPVPSGAPVSEVKAPVSGRLGFAERLQATEVLARSYGLESIGADIAALRRRVALPGVRVAVVGEFGRGKSTLINRLVGSEAVPTGEMTRTLVSVAGSPHPRVEVTLANGQVLAEPAGPWTWQRLAEVAEGQPVSQVRVFVDDPWLRDHDLELVDTPGSNDEEADDLDRVRRTLVVSDGALLVVSAQAPLSRLELAFLEEDVVGRRVSHVCVVVAMLDLVPADERASVLKYIQRRALRVASGAVVLAGPGLSGFSYELAALRDALADVASRSDRPALRTRQVLGELERHLAEMWRIGDQGRENDRLSEEERAAARKAAERATASREIEWRSVALELARRRHAHEDELHKKLEEAREALGERLRHELASSPDPKTWWERDLAYRLGPELTSVSRGLESLVQRRIADDVQWLDRQLVAAFGMADGVEAALLANGVTPKPQVETPTVALDDVERFRLIGRLGSGVAFVAGALLFPPVAAAAGIVAGVGVEVQGKAMVAAQRRDLEARISIVVESAVHDFSAHVSRRLTQLYDQLFVDVDRKRRAWIAAERVALNTRSSGTGPDWNALVSRATALRQTLTDDAARPDKQEQKEPS